MKRKNNKSRAPATATRQAPRPNVRKPVVQGTRGFLAGEINRLTNDIDLSFSVNQDIQAALSVMRARSRSAARNNPYARRYLDLLRSNIVGPDGVALSVQGMRQTQGGGEEIDPISSTIEKHFWNWSSPATCTVQGRIDFAKVQELVIEQIARDGEILIRFCRGPRFGKYNFALQILDADHLDENFNSTATNGNRILQSVEVDEYGKPVAYWIWRNNPADTMILAQGNERIRVPAEDMLHIFDPEQASQVRGYPWMASALVALSHIEKFKESVLINARVASDRQVYYQQDQNADAYEDEIDDMGYVELEARPGEHSVLPRGWSVVQTDWAQPTTTLDDFQKSILRSASAGLGISYNTFGADLENVNYSSARFGALEDQSNYRSIQRWFVNAFIKLVYEEFLRVQLLTNTWGLNIPVDRFEKFANVQYRTKTFGSVDPVKDITADINALKAGITSQSAVIEKHGGDPEAVFRQIAADKAKMDSLGITPAGLFASPPAAPQTE
mgnify:CR=1 FL=1